MQLEKIPKPGTTTGRKAFWDMVADAVLASRKNEGKNVSIDVHQGYGSVINVNPQRGSGLGACCIDGVCSQTTEAECEGVWQGVGVPCDEGDLCSNDGTGGNNSGACCAQNSCRIYTPLGCSIFHGVYQGDGTSCTPSPCGGACCDLSTGLCADNFSGDECEELPYHSYGGDGTTCEEVDCNLFGCCWEDTVPPEPSCFSVLDVDCELSFFDGGSYCCIGNAPFFNIICCVIGEEQCCIDFSGQSFCCPNDTICCDTNCCGEGEECCTFEFGQQCCPTGTCGVDGCL